MSFLRQTGSLLVIVVALAALGVALGVVLGRTNRSEAGSLTLRSSAVLASGDLGLWHDQAKTEPVTSLQFEGIAVQPPLRSIVTPVEVFVENPSTSDLFLVKPCGPIMDITTAALIGTLDAEVRNLDGKRLGNTCDFPPTVVVSADQMVRAELHIDLAPGLASGDFSFDTLFEVLGPPMAPDGLLVFGLKDTVFHIYALKPDGTRLSQITSGPGHDFSPSISPDGLSIVFDSTRDGDRAIFRSRIDGSDVIRLSPTGANIYEEQPVWSPDGSEIAFISMSGDNFELALMGPDGTGRIFLTNTPGNEAQPAWSPDGKKIAYSGQVGGNNEIFVIDVASRLSTNLTVNSADDRGPDWAPDGAKIVFKSNRIGGPSFEIYTMNGDGAEVIMLTTDTPHESSPHWSPDGDRIAFLVQHTGGIGIVAINADGGDRTTIITGDLAIDDRLTWSPSFGTAPPAPTPIAPPAGMVGWWPGDGNASDIVDGNHGTISGDATFTGGMVGQAFSFDGTGDFVVVPDSPSLNITSDVTVDLWARRTLFGSTIGTTVLVEKGAGAIGATDAPAAYTIFFTSDDQLNAGFERADRSNVMLIGPKVTDSAFHHYSYVRSGDTHKLFMDGVEVTGDTFTGNPGDTSGIELAIGALRHDSLPGGFCCYSGGIIDEVEVFNRALSAAEIRAIFEAGSAGKRKP